MLFAIGHFILMQYVSKKCADGYQFYDNKTIFIISIVFVAISILIIPIYQLTIIRYILIILLIFFVIYKRNNIKKIILYKKTWRKEAFYD